jgi:hypothetical protein
VIIGLSYVDNQNALGLLLRPAYVVWTHAAGLGLDYLIKNIRKAGV